MSRKRSFEKISISEYVSIGELARLTGSRYSTLKYYTEAGMLPFVQDGERRARQFNREKSIAVLHEIQQLKKQGFRISEIKQRFTLSEKD